MRIDQRIDDATMINLDLKAVRQKRRPLFVLWKHK